MLIYLLGVNITAYLIHLIFYRSAVTYRTTGFNVEAVQHKNVEMTIWDMAGRDTYQHVWFDYDYLQNTDILVYVV